VYKCKQINNAHISGFHQKEPGVPELADGQVLRGADGRRARGAVDVRRRLGPAARHVSHVGLED